MNLFSFLRSRTGVPVSPPRLAPALAAIAPAVAVPASAPSTPTPTLTTAADPPGDQAVVALLKALEDYLPTAAGTLPKPTVAVASMNQRSVGLGDRRGTERRGALAMVELKGLRLDA